MPEQENTKNPKRFHKTQGQGGGEGRGGGCLTGKHFAKVHRIAKAEGGGGEGGGGGGGGGGDVR